MKDQRVSKVYGQDKLEAQESESAGEYWFASSLFEQAGFMAITWLPFALTQSAFTFGSAD